MISLLLALFSAAAPLSASDGVALGADEARRLWGAGVDAVLAGERKMAESLWDRCLASNPHNKDCRAGLLLLGKEAASPVVPVETNLPDAGIPRGSRPNIQSRTDSKAAMKNWKIGVLQHQRGDLRGARDSWARCLEMDPANADCADGVARIDKSDGRPAAVSGGAKAAAKLNDEAMRAFMAGKREAARKAWTQCLEADPANEDCASGLNRLK